ncbi:MAG: TIGR00153 family protein [Deltaproteobacteria bacterium]|nr:TIGR00153 family protein [Deltaproteobacteria bacterium]
MRSIAGIFGRSPFKLLEQHMEKVKDVLDEVPPLFDALYESDFDRVKKHSENILKLEHEADKLKNDIRGQIPNSIFMPVDRRDFLNLLSAQDDIADAVEDLSIVLRLKNVTVPENIRPNFMELAGHVMDISSMANNIVQELDNLMEVSFGGPEADSVMAMINELSTMEWKADKLQFKLAREIFQMEETLSKGDFFVLLELGRKLGGLADKSEKVGKILRMFITG